MEWLLFTRFGRSGTFGGDDYPSISTAIQATKKKIKKNTLGGRGGPPNDEETHNNQPQYSVGDGGRLCDEISPR